MDIKHKEQIRDVLRQIGEIVCDKVYASLQLQSQEERAAVHEEGEDDTIYQIDKDVEDIIVPFLAQHAARLGGIALVAEGISTADRPLALPDDMDADQAAIRLIMDPIDGTRGIMYDKRSAFFLAGAAFNQGKDTCLQDIQVAVMTELPTSKSLYSDSLWAIRGQELSGERRNLYHQEKHKLSFNPSGKKTIAGGFAQIARFFPPGRDILAAVEERMVAVLFPDIPEGKALLFEDQYISTGGQMYEMIMGHDRFIADIRTCLFNKLKKEGKKAGHVCHPYDVCASLIAQEAGIILTDAYGKILDAPLDTVSAVDWIGYANQAIKNEVEPALQAAMECYGLFHEA